MQVREFLLSVQRSGNQQGCRSSMSLCGPFSAFSVRIQHALGSPGLPALIAEAKISGHRQNLQSTSNAFAFNLTCNHQQHSGFPHALTLKRKPCSSTDNCCRHATHGRCIQPRTAKRCVPFPGVRSWRRFSYASPVAAIEPSEKSAQH